MKAIIKFGWNEYVVSWRDAEAILSIVEKAPRYDSRWANEERSHYVWNEPMERPSSIDLLTDEQFEVAKLAGKPE